MIIYLSGTFGTKTWEEEREWLKTVPSRHRCFSFYYVWRDGPGFSQRQADCFYGSMKDGVGVMLDSGGHTLHQLVKGKGALTSQEFEKVKENMFVEYMKFCHVHKKQLDSYVTFDYVPEAELTWKMTERMWNNGLDPVPVFHGDVGVEWLQKYIDHGCAYIGVSGVFTAGKNKRTTANQRYHYLDDCFRIICDGQGKPKVKVHGFAVTAFSLMDKYPFYSVDSSTWMKAAIFGKILIPGRSTTRMIRVSKKAVGSTDNYWTLSPEEREQLDELFERYKTSIVELSDVTAVGAIARKSFNAKVFARYTEGRSLKVRFSPRFQPLF